MMKKILYMSLLMGILAGNLIHAIQPKVVRVLYISPQIKLGKLENGNGFSEIQYVKFQYDISNMYTLEGGLSTGFTAPRNDILSYNHSINRLGLKFTYRPFDTMGFFFEGSFTDNISGATNPASYFVYDNYQAIGVNWDIKTFTFK